MVMLQDGGAVLMKIKDIKFDAELVKEVSNLSRMDFLEFLDSLGALSRVEEIIYEVQKRVKKHMK